MNTADQPHPSSQLALSGEVLIKTIRELGNELKINPISLEKLDLDTSFDTDLGLDSLTRVEFIARIEKQFRIQLSESAFSNVTTPRELLREILGAGSAANPGPEQEFSTLTLEASDASPKNAQTLTEILDWHLQAHPDRPHIQFHQDSGDGEIISYRHLHESASAIAAGLQARGFQPGQAAAIMLPTCPDYFYTFFGILAAGGIPVPIYPPARLNQIEDHLIRHKSILNNCAAVFLITIQEALPVARLLKSHVESLESIVTATELQRNRSIPLRPKLSGQDIAFLQYTSGSTGLPKGVTLSHANLLANIRAMGSLLRVDSSDVFISWLPLYHDMGLIGAWFGSFYYSALLVVLSPLDFLAKPERWLRAIHRHRGTLTAAPNFAYELCLKRTDQDALSGLKLDSVRAMFNGAEPVSPGTLAAFAQRFSDVGLNPKALMPVYGLAECSVGLTFPPLGRGPLIDRVSRERFIKQGIATPDPKSPDALQFVSCGAPIKGHEVRIVDDSGREVPDRNQGYLQFRGPSTSSGYYKNPEKTRALFDQDWLNSGDLAYIGEGEVYLTGRAKDLIIHAGRNLYPQELEEKVSEVPGIRKGCVAVFGCKDLNSGTEKLIVLAETRATELEERHGLEVEINRVIMNLIGSAPDEVILAPARTVLKTSSGKLRRSACKELYENKQLGKGDRSVWLQFSTLLLSGIAPELRRFKKSLVSGIYAAYAWIVFSVLTALTWPSVVCCPTFSLRIKIIRYAVRTLCWLTQTRIVTRGAEHLSGLDQPCVLVCNHCSYLDGAILLMALPLHFSFVAKAELKEQILARIFLKRIETEFVTRFEPEKGVADSEKITQAARSGKNLLFFPEGTFTRIPGLRPFYMGAFKTAAETGHTLIPVVIHGTRSILRSDSWFPRHGSIHVEILPPIMPKSEESAGDPWRVAMTLREATRQVILLKLREPDLAS
ncbi:MAG: AMP-binding protein [Methylococcaceae bacterium]|nr:AMP-binding protein [Methylococcaceae bacterium]